MRRLARGMSTWLQNVTILVLICVPLALHVVEFVSHALFHVLVFRHNSVHWKLYSISAEIQESAALGQLLSMHGDLGELLKIQRFDLFLNSFFMFSVVDFVWMRDKLPSCCVLWPSGAATLLVTEKHEHEWISITICLNDEEEKI